MPLLARPNANGARYFPAIDQLLETSTHPGAQLFALAQSPFHARRPRLPEQRAAAVLWLFLEGFRAEFNDQWDRADFYFEEMRLTLARITRSEEMLGRAFEPLLARLSGAGQLPAAAIATHLINEVLIDAHLGFLNGRIQRPGGTVLDKRAGYHLERIEQLLACSDLSPSERLGFLRPMHRARFEASRAAQRWSEAQALAQRQFEAEPGNEEVQSQWIVATVEATHARLGSGDSQESNERDAKVAGEAIGLLEKAGLKMPLNAELYDALCGLHQTRAVHLAIAGQLSSSLVSIEKALAIRPASEEAQSLRGKLMEMMTSLQENVQRMEVEAATQRNAVLSKKGLELQREAHLGFGPVNKFIDSGAAGELTLAAQDARNVMIWRQIGLADPPEEQVNRARDLVSSLAAIIAQEPADHAAIAMACSSLTADQPALASLDSEKIVNFLAHKILGEPWQPFARTAWEFVCEPSDAPILITAFGKRKRGGAPFLFWIYSAQDVGMKLRWVAVFIVTAITVGLWTHEAGQRGQRDLAFASLVSATRSQDTSGVMNAAEGFLAARPFALDQREAQVVEAYRDAFVQWFRALEKLTAADQETVERFRRLTAGKLETLDRL